MKFGEVVLYKITFQKWACKLDLSWSQKNYESFKMAMFVTTQLKKPRFLRFIILIQIYFFK